MTSSELSELSELSAQLARWFSPATSEPEPAFTMPVIAGQDDPDGARAWLDQQAEQAGQAWDGHRK